MSIEALKIISDAMKSLGLNYSFMTYKVGAGQKLPEMYFTGEYQESPPLSEDGEQETSFILNGFTRGTLLSLEEAKKKIKSYFPKVSGKTVITDSGSAVVVFYSNSFTVPTEDAELKRIQINLTIKEWSVIE